VLVQAIAEEQLGDLAAANRLYLHAVDLQPLNWRSWYELGRFQFDQQRYKDAVNSLRRAVELDRYGSGAPALLREALAQVG
jgi:tetratricopeptide (TPR) repeat protein